MVGKGRYLSRGSKDCLSFSRLHALASRLRCLPRGAAQSMGAAASRAKREVVLANAAEPRRKVRRESEAKSFSCCMKTLLIDVDASKWNATCAVDSQRMSRFRRARNIVWRPVG